MPGVHSQQSQHIPQQPQSPLSPMSQLMILNDVMPLPLLYNPFFHFPFMRNGREIQIERLIQEFLENDPNNYGPQPAAQDNISKLQSKQVQKGCTDSCSICQDNLKEGEYINELPCKHIYHKECINEWLSRHNSCPICRKGI